MATMKAVQIHEFGDVDVLKYEDVERPEPQAGEVLVRVRAAGINPMDCTGRKFPVPGITAGHLPYVLGWDIAGSVVALGEGVTQFAVGDEVYGMPRFPGEAKAYSEYITSPVADLALKPQRLTHQEAAGVPMAGLIAWQALFDRPSASGADRFHFRWSGWRRSLCDPTRQMEGCAGHYDYFYPQPGVCA